MENVGGLLEGALQNYLAPALPTPVETVLMMGHNIPFKGVLWKNIHILSCLSFLIWNSDFVIVISR